MSWRKHKVDTSVFDDINEQSAYWIGFLMADGCIHENKRNQCKKLSISLKKGDVSHLIALKEFLRSNQEIRFYNNPPAGWKSNGSARLDICCTELANRLERYGVLPRKSMTAEVLLLENNKDFWRGMIDGDGWVTIENRTRILVNGEKTFKWPVIGLCGSHRMIEQFSHFVQSIVPGWHRKISSNHSIWRISVSGRSAVKVIKELYGNCMVALPRKLAVANSVIEDNQGKLLDKSRWEVVSPNGSIFVVSNQKMFAEQHGIHYGNLNSMLQEEESLVKVGNLKLERNYEIEKVTKLG